MPHDAVPLSPDACYLAMKARDARFDGSFYTGVTSTGIYCRPVCKVRTPRRENCRFFHHAAQAEKSGFRPCLRCRPELAPATQAHGGAAWSTQDASAILALQAARLLDEPDAWPDGEGPSMEVIATRLGVSDRHLRRIFESRFGVSPLQYLQTRRLLTAKQLLADTRLPIAQVALASGFASLRRFNAAFAAHYRMPPSRLRREGDDGSEVGADKPIRLAWRPPYDVRAMVRFVQVHVLRGVDFAEPATAGANAVIGHTLAIGGGTGARHTGWIRCEFDEAHHRVLLRVSEGLLPALPRVVRRVRAALDLDADPVAINAVLDPHFPAGAGLRMPGALSGFEMAVRAILGQQVTLAAAHTIGARLVARFGEPIATPHPALTHLFPRADALARATSDELGTLGIVRQRQAAIVALAQAVDDGRIELHPGADVPRTIAALLELPGIGDWTAQYLAMRALRWPDAFPAGDVALQKALGVRGEKNPARAAEAASEAWRPWRSYAVVRAWGTL